MCRFKHLAPFAMQARDFDPDSLRSMLPQAVQALAQAVLRGERVYVHCTAGLGRSPAVIIAYMYWWGYQSMQLDAAYKHLTEIRCEAAWCTLHCPACPLAPGMHPVSQPSAAHMSCSMSLAAHHALQ